MRSRQSFRFEPKLRKNSFGRKPALAGFDLISQLTYEYSGNDMEGRWFRVRFWAAISTTRKVEINYIDCSGKNSKLSTGSSVWGHRYWVSWDVVDVVINS